MIKQSVVTITLVAAAITAAASQAPAVVDTGRLGPQVGATVPAFSGVDQFGRPHTMTSVMGPKGAMLVFFRSADW